MTTIEGIKSECRLAILEDANSMPVFRGMFKPRAAKALLVTIEALEDVASSDGDPHVDESAEYWAKEASSGKAKEALETLRRTWEESK